MQIRKLDHVNIWTTRLDHLITWYSEVLGLKSGFRPNFPFPGAWMYAGDQAVVHLVGQDEPANVGSEVKLKLEHFAFTATGLAEFEQRLRDHDIAYKRSEIEDTRMIAINVWDPDGNHIHVDFSMDE